MNRTQCLVFCIFMLLPADVALAVDYAMDIHRSVMGDGIGLTMDINPEFSIRTGVNMWGPEYEHTIDDEGGLIFSKPEAEYDSKYLFLDFKSSLFQTVGDFYLTLGGISNNYNVHTTSLVETGGQRIGEANAPIGTRLNGALHY